MQKNTMLTEVARYDRGSLPGEAEVTEEGYVRAKAIVTRCGVFLYKNADGTIRKELRHPDEVLKMDSLESMKMVPVVNGHPPERLVNAENAKRLAVGYTGETVETNMPYVLANLVITDKQMVDEIVEKKKRELSLGYTVDLVEEPGLYYGEPYDYMQTNIRYNHLAVVDQARAGPEARIALDGEDAIEIFKEEAEKMASKTKVKGDTEEYLVDNEAGGKVEALMAEVAKHQKRAAELEAELAKAHAERDHLKEKIGGEHAEEEVDKEHMEKDEIGANGKEVPDPVDLYGQQSHVRDYTPPSKMENHVVENPGNKHYPHDLPHIPKVDSADVNRRVRNRVKLEKLAERYLDRNTLNRMDSMEDLDVKKAIVQAIQPRSNLEGKSEMYINARFDAVCEDLPQQNKGKVIAVPQMFKGDENPEKDNANALDARKRMIARQKEAWKPAKRGV